MSSFASRSATARPMPPDPPVISATRAGVVSVMMMFSSLTGVG